MHSLPGGERWPGILALAFVGGLAAEIVFGLLFDALGFMGLLGTRFFSGLIGMEAVGLGMAAARHRTRQTASILAVVVIVANLLLGVGLTALGEQGARPFNIIFLAVGAWGTALIFELKKGADTPAPDPSQPT